MTAINVLTSITVVLLIGLLISIIASKLKIPSILMLIASGIALGSIKYRGTYLIDFPVIFLTATSILALALIIFDSTSKLKIREFDAFSMKGLKLAFVFLLLNLIFIPILTTYLFKLSVSLGILLATIMMGTSPEITLSMLSGAKQRTIEILKMESIINTPLTVLFPFLLLDLMQKMELTILSTIIDQIGPFLTKFAAGIGSGMLVAIILFKVLKGRVSKTYTPLTVIVSALLAYVLAENIGGSGVLAVTTLGVFVGNISKKKKGIAEVMTVESFFAKTLYILVFVLIGFIIKIPIEKDFFISAGILFAAYLAIRYLSIAISFRGKEDGFSFKEKLFMTLNMPKGIAVAVVAFTLATYNIPGTATYMPGMKIVLDLTLLFMLATIVLSSAATFFAKALIGEEPKPEK